MFFKQILTVLYHTWRKPEYTVQSNSTEIYHITVLSYFNKTSLHILTPTRIGRGNLVLHFPPDYLDTVWWIVMLNGIKCRQSLLVFQRRENIIILKQSFLQIKIEPISIMHTHWTQSECTTTAFIWYLFSFSFHISD